jgi:F-type H+-transporting ATPase subunit delta
MSNHKVSERYAKSLYSLAKEKGNVAEVLEDIKTYQKTIADNHNLATVINSPIINTSKKQAILNQLFAPRFQPITSMFFKLILEKGRDFELGGIAKSFIEEDKKQKGIKDCLIATAAPLTTELLASLTQKGEQMAGGKIEVSVKIDPSLIGGYILTVGDLQYDESVKTKLSKIGSQLIDHSYIPKIDLI